MNRETKSSIIFCAALLTLTGFWFFSWGQGDAGGLSTKPEMVIKDWPPQSMITAKTFMEKYGQPARVRTDALVWEGVSPWKRIVIHREGWIDESGVKRSEFLEQTVDYPFPRGRSYDLASFDRRVNADETAGELTARHDTERLNYLALNLADEIITGAKSPDEARSFYRKQIWLKGSGKNAHEMEGFHFSVGAPKRR